MNASYAVVDPLIAGDGKGGTKTEKTEIPWLFAMHGWMWSDETAARVLYENWRVPRFRMSIYAATRCRAWR